VFNHGIYGRQFHRRSLYQAFASMALSLADQAGLRQSPYLERDINGTDTKAWSPRDFRR
jgi:hypothetical protein